MTEHEVQEPALPAPVAGLPADMADLAGQMVTRARQSGIELTGTNGLLTALTRQVLQTALEEEMAAHLGYEKHDQAGMGRGTPATAVPRRRSALRSVTSRSGFPGTGPGRSSRRSCLSISAGWLVSMRM